MPIKVNWVETPSGIDIHTGRPFDGFFNAEGDDTLIIDTNYFQAHGVFRTNDITTQTTTTVVTPDSGGSIIITDVIIGAKKVNNATLDLQFTDGVDTVLIYSPDINTDPVNFSWSPQGRIQGWRNAQLDIVTATANPDASVLVGFVKIPNGLLFAEWDSLR